MGKIGRFACIFVPMALTLASLICLALVMSGQLNKSSSVQRDLYFFRVNTTGFTSDPDNIVSNLADSVDTSNTVLNALKANASTTDMKDVYYIGLWNYCAGDIDDNGKETITNCSARKSNYYFNPIEVWGLKNTTLQESIDDGDLQKGLNAYQKAAKWMYAAFVIAIVLTAVEFVVGILAIFSRWGSFVTTIVSAASTIFIIAAASTATGIYVSLLSVFKSVLGPYNFEASIGSRMFSVMWLGVAFSIGSGFFWFISVCCCSGKSPHKKTKVEKSAYTYERVASPAFGGQQHSQPSHPAPAAGHGNSGTAYEPFRQQHV